MASGGRRCPSIAVAAGGSDALAVPARRSTLCGWHVLSPRGASGATDAASLGELGVGGCAEAWGAGSSCNLSARLRCHPRRRCRVALLVLPGAERAQRDAQVRGVQPPTAGGCRVRGARGPPAMASSTWLGAGAWSTATGFWCTAAGSAGLWGGRDGGSVPQRVPALLWVQLPTVLPTGFIRGTGANEQPYPGLIIGAPHGVWVSPGTAGAGCVSAARCCSTNPCTLP